MTAVLGIVMLMAGMWAASTVVQPTSAAWTDKTHTSATVTAGTWSSAKNTCTAVDAAGKPMPCAVTGLRYDEWGTPGNRVRNYYITTSAVGARHLDFSVDLSTASGAGGSFAWTNAGVATGAQFTPTNGWTCAKLPLVTGKTPEWFTNPFFTVYENKTGQSVMCG
ncbi:SipW-dependent-type signal peptide-containing protein [Microbacterium sp. NPDC019599]|uniref:SipW-dependent-type signal peptide-containing protein n=1 Tax=Microbacterium sp. NPDC019599 TaxID=3154690 RepID=UPI0033E9020F